MSMMHEVPKPMRKRTAQPKENASKRIKASNSARPSLTQLLSRKAAKGQPLSPSNNSNTSPATKLQDTTQSKDPQMHEKGATQITDDSSMAFVLSRKRRVTVRKWKGMKLIDIREFYDDQNVAKPGKKGISLSPEQWEKLNDFSDAINEAIKLVEQDVVGIEPLAGVTDCIMKPGGDERAIALPLSDKRRVTVRYFRNGVLIDLREHYAQDGVFKPGKKGITLSKDQWSALQEVSGEISKAAHNL
ncbi:hypothetical protein CCR75_008306 [Bremia lactucae]|uniref:Transcriptional coactivator p15 (PC4) C-terminal domain-containing protein n=1 Tax=Bremia lactucae TaxID=4779 RepID=A0A976NYR1_BRELC|nr:hypothetical protein CCR75_008306 [Bremia lactucae]